MGFWAEVFKELKSILDPRPLFRRVHNSVSREDMERAHVRACNLMKDRVLGSNDPVKPVHFFYRDSENCKLIERNWTTVRGYGLVMQWARYVIRENRYCMYSLGCGFDFINSPLGKCMVVTTQAPGGELMMSLYKVLPGRDLLQINDAGVMEEVATGMVENVY